jgi:3-oxoadipate enol-lactonase
MADAVLERWFTPSFHSSQPAELARFRSMLVSTPGEGYIACCEVLGEVDFRPRLGEIAAPTLVITGAADPVVPPDAGEELAASIPGARHVTIERAAHIANVEQPEAFADAVLGFLSEGAAG